MVDDHGRTQASFVGEEVEEARVLCHELHVRDGDFLLVGEDEELHLEPLDVSSELESILRLLGVIHGHAQRFHDFGLNDLRRESEDKGRGRELPNLQLLDPMLRPLLHLFLRLLPFYGIAILDTGG